MMFCPGNRPDRFAQACERADGVIVDLEDAVPTGEKDVARQHVVRAFTEGRLDAARVVVRINSTDGPWGRMDLKALARTASRLVMWPKAQGKVPDALFAGFNVIALCETPRGVIDAPRLADSGNCVGLAWGGQDLAFRLGAPPLDSKGGTLHTTAKFARMSVLYAAAAAAKPAIDTIRAEIDDTDGLRGEAKEAFRMGFAAKLAIHPRQVPVVRDAFQPDGDELAWAERVVAACEEGGVAVVDGEMIDPPIVARAQRLLARMRP